MAEPCDNLYPKCICCGGTPEAGIVGGILIWGRFICDGCQESLVNAEIGDQAYDQVMEALKETWGRARRQAALPSSIGRVEV